jgi:phage replication O-like protein O
MALNPSEGETFNHDRRTGDKYSKLSHRLEAVLIAGDFNALEMKLVLLINRKTVGFNKQDRVTQSFAQMAKATRYHESNVKKSIHDLVERNCIIKTKPSAGRSSRNIYQVNFDFSLWVMECDHEEAHEDCKPRMEDYPWREGKGTRLATLSKPRKEKKGSKSATARGSKSATLSSSKSATLNQKQNGTSNGVAATERQERDRERQYKGVVSKNGSQNGALEDQIRESLFG